ncbi:MAG: carbonic anhydrase [Sphingomonas bacterium]|nr:carbonic anhydrase [Sphingomonas bacterium]
MSGFDTLLDGYRRFREDGWATQRARWSELAEGQSPGTLVIACSDSRVDPAQIFDVSPGEIFVVRNVGNLVPPFEADNSRHGVSAAVEFAVTQIPVSNIIVLGHEYCGGCKAAMTRAFEGHAPGAGGFIAHWVDMLDEARDRIVAEHGHGDGAERMLEREAVKVSLANLRSFPFVAEAEAAGTLSLRGAWFGIREGELKLLDETSGEFHAA